MCRRVYCGACSAAQHDVDEPVARQAELGPDLRFRGIAEIAVALVASGELKLQPFLERNREFRVGRVDVTVALERRRGGETDEVVRLGIRGELVATIFVAGRKSEFARTLDGQLVKAAVDRGVVAEAVDLAVETVGTGIEVFLDVGIVGGAEGITRRRSRGAVERGLQIGRGNQVRIAHRFVAPVTDRGFPIPNPERGAAQTGDARHRRADDFALGQIVESLDARAGDLEGLELLGEVFAVVGLCRSIRSGETGGEDRAKQRNAAARGDGGESAVVNSSSGKRGARDACERRGSSKGTRNAREVAPRWQRLYPRNRDPENRFTTEPDGHRSAALDCGRGQVHGGLLPSLRRQIDHLRGADFDGARA